ncbi:MAG TPA: NAD-dependent epimerase/dehydratase family protein [Streptosporangiaceae bacterium]
MKVLYIGGTGTISASCVARSVREGSEVHLLNRGRNAGQRPVPDGVSVHTADVHDVNAAEDALAGHQFDCVVDFLSFDEKDAAAAVQLWAGRTAQYIQISSASIYHKPVHRIPFVESTPRHNPYLPYARAKIAAENVVRAAYEERQFPATIVRPSHTYDDARPPLPGDWTAWDRLVRGDEIVVPGDGTNLWTITHASDFAVGLTGLIGNHQAIGEDFHITSDETLPWDEIYRSIATAVSGAARLIHLPTELISLVAPDWGWTPLFAGDLGHSALFDNSKIKRFVPAFRPVVTWSQGVRKLAGWRAEHPDSTRPDPGTDAIMGRLVRAWHVATDAVTAEFSR